MVNRLDEDLTLATVEAKVPFIAPEYVQDEYGEMFGGPIDLLTPSPRTLNHTVEACGTKTFAFWLPEPSVEGWLRLTISSSARTLCAKRLTVCESQMPQSKVCPDEGAPRLPDFRHLRARNGPAKGKLSGPIHRPQTAGRT